MGLSDWHHCSASNSVFTVLWKFSSQTNEVMFKVEHVRSTWTRCCRIAGFLRMWVLQSAHLDLTVGKELILIITLDNWLTSQSLGFPICKVGQTVLSTSFSNTGNRWEHVCEHLASCQAHTLGTQQAVITVSNPTARWFSVGVPSVCVYGKVKGFSSFTHRQGKQWMVKGRNQDPKSSFREWAWQICTGPNFIISPLPLWPFRPCRWHEVFQRYDIYFLM